MLQIFNKDKFYQSIIGFLLVFILLIVSFLALKNVNTLAIYSPVLGSNREYFRVKIKEIQGVNSQNQTVARAIAIEGESENMILDTFFSSDKNFQEEQIVIARINTDNRIELIKDYNLDILYIIILTVLVFLILIAFIDGALFILGYVGILGLIWNFLDFFQLQNLSPETWLLFLIFGIILNIVHLKFNLKLLIASNLAWFLNSIFIFYLNYFILRFFNLESFNFGIYFSPLFLLISCFYGFFIHLNLVEKVYLSLESRKYLKTEDEEDEEDVKIENQIKQENLTITFKESFKNYKKENLKLLSFSFLVLILINLPFFDSQNHQQTPIWLFLSEPILFNSLSLFASLTFNTIIISLLSFFPIYLIIKPILNTNQTADKKEKETPENLFIPKEKLDYTRVGEESKFSKSADVQDKQNKVLDFKENFEDDFSLKFDNKKDLKKAIKNQKMLSSSQESDDNKIEKNKDKRLKEISHKNLQALEDIDGNFVDSENNKTAENSSKKEKRLKEIKLDDLAKHKNELNQKETLEKAEDKSKLSKEIPQNESEQAKTKKEIIFDKEKLNEELSKEVGFKTEDQLKKDFQIKSPETNHKNKPFEPKKIRSIDPPSEIIKEIKGFNKDKKEGEAEIQENNLEKNQNKPQDSQSLEDKKNLNLEKSSKQEIAEFNTKNRQEEFKKSFKNEGEISKVEENKSNPSIYTNSLNQKIEKNNFDTNFDTNYRYEVDTLKKEQEVKPNIIEIDKKNTKSRKVML
jgi:hypothetical protein